MKFLFNLFFAIYIMFFSSALKAENYKESFRVITNGITIGKLFWDLQIDNNKYSLIVELKSKGLVSALLRFKGYYLVEGRINDGIFLPQSYLQKWDTGKKQRDIEIVFKENKVLKINQKPNEKEFQRIEIEKLEGYSDPLTSFIKLLDGSTDSKTIDGRRVYTFKKNNENQYLIKDFKNIWADHKRNNLKEISIFIGSKKYIPEAIHIKFKNRLFKVLRN